MPVQVSPLLVGWRTPNLALVRKSSSEPPATVTSATATRILNTTGEIRLISSPRHSNGFSREWICIACPSYPFGPRREDPIDICTLWSYHWSRRTCTQHAWSASRRSVATRCHCVLGAGPSIVRPQDQEGQAMGKDPGLGL
jgi:hypothetical protein